MTNLSDLPHLTDGERDLARLHDASTQGEWRVYSGKLRPQFPKPVIELHVRKHGSRMAETLVGWSGFDGLAMCRAGIKANLKAIAVAHNQIPDLLREISRLREAQSQSAADRTIRADCEEPLREMALLLADVHQATQGDAELIWAACAEIKRLRGELQALKEQPQ